MKLKEEFVKLPKPMLYSMYESIVYDPKDYDNITRGKMLDEIIKEYKQDNFLYSICTVKELMFLDKLVSNEINSKNIDKYSCEIKMLNSKFILSSVTNKIFDEQKNNVLEALKYYKNHSEYKKKEDDLIIFMISVVKVNVELLCKAFIGMISSFSGLKDADVNSLMGHPLFHFYCDFFYKYFDSIGEEEVVYFREYYDLLDELDDARKEFGMAGSIEFDIRDYFDIFYYDFPLRKKSVNKFYNYVNKRPDKDLIFMAIKDARVLNYSFALDYFIEDEKVKEMAYDALYEMPCAAMNGFTPRQYDEEIEKEEKLYVKFNRVPQNNAHLPKSACDEFYKLYFALLEYVNDKYNISKKIKKIYMQEGLNAELLLPINDYLWNHRNVIDDFIEDNDYKFNEEELNIIKTFKDTAISGNFVMIGFEREYTEFLELESGKIYMVKGLRCDFDKIVDVTDLPINIETTLLMFKGKIIFNSFFSAYPIVFGNDIREFMLREYESAIKYYHL